MYFQEIALVTPVTLKDEAWNVHMNHLWLSSPCILVESAVTFRVNALEAFYSWSYTNCLGDLFFTTSKFMVTFYFKMLLFIHRGEEVEVNLLRKERGYFFFLECTLNDLLSPSFVSAISAMFSMKLNPVRLKSKKRETKDSCKQFTCISFLCFLSRLSVAAHFGLFFFSCYFFPSC